MNKKVKLAMTAVMLGLSVITFTGCGSNANNAKSAVAAQVQMPKDPLKEQNGFSRMLRKTWKPLIKQEIPSQNTIRKIL